MTPEVFGRFLYWLLPDPELAARHYLEIRTKLVKSFIRRGCAHSEELSDKTLDRVAVIVYNEPDKYSNRIALCCGVARKVWLEYLREMTPDSLETENIPAPNRGDTEFKEHEAKCLNSCIDELPQGQRDLIIQYHQFQGREKIEARQRLAREYGGLNKLRITAYRIRVKLHDCIRGCVQRVAAN